jgi:hypothetical protein
MLAISSRLLLIEFSRFMESKLAWVIFHTWTFCQLHSPPTLLRNYLSFIRNPKVSAFCDAMMKRHCLFAIKMVFLKFPTFSHSPPLLNWVIFNPLLFYVLYFNDKKLFLCVISLSSLSFFISFSRDAIRCYPCNIFRLSHLFL